MLCISHLRSFAKIITLLSFSVMSTNLLNTLYNQMGAPFKDGRAEVKDAPRPSRPLSAVSGEKNRSVKTATEDARYTVDMVG